MPSDAYKAVIKDLSEPCPTCGRIELIRNENFNVQGMERLMYARRRLKDAYTTCRQLNGLSQEEKDKLAEAIIFIETLEEKLTALSKTMKD